MKIYLVVLIMISSIATSCKPKTNGSLVKEDDDSVYDQDSENSDGNYQGDKEEIQNTTGGGFGETGGTAVTTGGSRRESPKCEASYQMYKKKIDVWNGDIVAIRCTVKVPADNEPPLCGDRSYRAEVDSGQKEVIEGVNPGEFQYMLNKPCRCTCILPSGNEPWWNF